MLQGNNTALCQLPVDTYKFECIQINQILKWGHTERLWPHTGAAHFSPEQNQRTSIYLFASIAHPHIFIKAADVRDIWDLLSGPHKVITCDEHRSHIVLGSFSSPGFGAENESSSSAGPRRDIPVKVSPPPLYSYRIDQPEGDREPVSNQDNRPGDAVSNSMCVCVCVRSMYCEHSNPLLIIFLCPLGVIYTHTDTHIQWEYAGCDGKQRQCIYNWY